MAKTVTLQIRLRESHDFLVVLSIKMQLFLSSQSKGYFLSNYPWVLVSHIRIRRSKFLAVITIKYTTMVSSLLLLFFGLQFVNSEIHANNAENSLPGLELKRIEHKAVEGCWKDHDQVVPVCFHISNKLMRVTHSQSSDILALYYTNRIGSIHYTQALGTGLLG